MGGGEHDWTYMLGELGLLRQDRAIAHGVHFVGVMLLIVSCLWGWMYASAKPGAKTGDEPMAGDAPG